MSMSVRCDETAALEYAGALGLSGLFPSWRNALRPSYLRMLAEIPRFHRMAKRLLRVDRRRTASDETLRRVPRARPVLAACSAPHFMESLVACVWSCDPAVALDYPARYLFTFLDHHGMLGVFGSPQWRTVTGGSQEYVERVAARLPDVRTGTKVDLGRSRRRPASRSPTATARSTPSTPSWSPPTRTRRWPCSPSRPPAQRDVLGGDRRTPPTPRSCTPTPACCRARRGAGVVELPAPARRRRQRAGVTVSYDMTRLHAPAGRPDGRRFIVTLGGQDLVDQSQVDRHDGVRAPDLHPDLGRRAAPAARVRQRPDRLRRRLARLGLPRGRRPSGVEAAARLGVELGRTRAAPGRGHVVRHHDPAHPADTVQAHRSPTESRTWLVDLDHLPDHGAARSVRGPRPPRRPGPHPEAERRALPRPQRRARPTAAGS